MSNTTGMNFVAAYGTLRNNHYNFKRFAPQGLEYNSTHRVKGFELWDLGPYPYVIEKEDSEITIDILQMDDITKRRIDNMELGADYKMKQITIDGKDCTIYFMDRIYKNTTLIPSGDYNDKK